MTFVRKCAHCPRRASAVAPGLVAFPLDVVVTCGSLLGERSPHTHPFLRSALICYMPLVEQYFRLLEDAARVRFLRGASSPSCQVKTADFSDQILSARFLLLSARRRGRSRDRLSSRKCQRPTRRCASFIRKATHLEASLLPPADPNQPLPRTPCASRPRPRSPQVARKISRDLSVQATRRVIARYIRANYPERVSRKMLKGAGSLGQHVSRKPPRCAECHPDPPFPPTPNTPFPDLPLSARRKAERYTWLGTSRFDRGLRIGVRPALRSAT